VPPASWQHVADCESCELPANRPAVAAGDQCASWCEWVPIPAQQYPAGCAGCNNHATLFQLEALPKNQSGASGRKLRGCASFCQWVPTASQQYVAACEACEQPDAPAVVAGDRCASWCEWVPVPAQQYPADCTGCSTSTHGDVHQPENTSHCEDHCRWVPPASWQHVADCESCELPANRPAVAAGDQCASWCEWVPIPAQQYPAGCAGCNNDATLLQLEALPKKESGASYKIEGKTYLRGTTTTILP